MSSNATFAIVGGLYALTAALIALLLATAFIKCMKPNAALVEEDAAAATNLNLRGQSVRGFGCSLSNDQVCQTFEHGPSLFVPRKAAAPASQPQARLT